MDNGSYVPLIIDVEASGFGAGSYPIEFGVALSSGVGFSMLIRPEPDWVHWDARAQQLHGLKRSELMASGHVIRDVANRFNSLLNGQKLYSDGWTVDKPWITTLFHAARVPMQFSVHPIEQIMCESQFEIWDDTKQQIIERSNDSCHRAGNDAYIIQQTYANTRAQVSNDSVKQNKFPHSDFADKGIYSARAVGMN